MTDVRRRILDQRWHRPSGLRLCLAELRGTRPAVRHAVGWLPAWDGLLFGHRFHRAEETARAEFEARVATFPLIGIPAPSRDVDLLDILPWAYGKVPDAHVGLVYAWERIVIGPRASRELVDLDRAVIAIHETLDFFDCHGTDRVSLGRRGRGSRANGFGEIVLEHDGTGRVSLSTAIHEATHLATLHSSPAHGPVFVAAVAAAYGHHYGIDVAAALDRARTMGIPAAPASWLPDIASGWFRRTAGEHRAESTVLSGADALNDAFDPQAEVDALHAVARRLSRQPFRIAPQADRAAQFTATIGRLRMAHAERATSSVRTAEGVVAFMSVRRESEASRDE